MSNENVHPVFRPMLDFLSPPREERETRECPECLGCGNVETGERCAVHLRDGSPEDWLLEKCARCGGSGEIEVTP